MLPDSYTAWINRPCKRTMDLFLVDARAVFIRVLHRILKGDPLHEDLAQECLVKITDGAAFTYTGRGSVESWLEVVAKNAAMDWLRGPQRREESHEGNRAFENLGTDWLTPERLAVDKQARQRVEAALEELRRSGARKSARIIRAYYLLGQPLQQIAEDEGLRWQKGRGRNSSAKQMLHRAREDFRAVLKEKVR